MPSGNKPLPEPDLCLHMVSLGHNELTGSWAGTTWKPLQNGKNVTDDMDLREKIITILIPILLKLSLGVKFIKINFR